MKRAEVRMPSNEEVEEIPKKVILEKNSMLHDVYCVSDGLKIYIEQAGDFAIQTMFHNGCTHDHYVGNVFVSAPSSVIFACALNTPGNMHDSHIAEWEVI